MRERFTEELKAAMRAGDKRRLGTIRLIQAALKDKDIEARGAGKGQATEEEILALLQKMIKQRQESIAIYEQNDRAELAQQEREEAEVIQSFLPQQMDEAETKAAIQAGISVWPNPAEQVDAVNVRLSNLGTGTAVITLTDALGRSVVTKEATLDNGIAETTISIKHLPAGVYSLRARANGGTVIREIVVK